MITDKKLIELGLVSHEAGYYEINDDITVDVEGNIRIDNEYTTRPIWIAEIHDIEELKILMKFLLR